MSGDASSSLPLHSDSLLLHGFNASFSFDNNTDVVIENVFMSQQQFGQNWDVLLSPAVVDRLRHACCETSESFILHWSFVMEMYSLQLYVGTIVANDIVCLRYTILT